MYSLTSSPTSTPWLSTSFTQKSIGDRDCLVWTSDERFALRLAAQGASSIDVYPGRNLSTAPLFRLQTAGGEGGLAQFSLAPNDRFVGAVVAEQGTTSQLPCRVVLFDLGRGGATTIPPFYAKTLPFGVDAATVELNWARSGLGLLITATTSTGSGNYYGTTSLHFLRIAEGGAGGGVGGGAGGATVVVEERIANSAQTSVWSETSDEFLALTGDFPCEVGLYDGRTGRMKTSFGKYRRNTLVFQSFSRYFICLGLGNLPGDFELFDKNKGLVLASGRLVCPVQVLFAPDGRTWLTATTAPRMRVDNGFALYNYDGTPILNAKVAVNDLYHVAFLPPAQAFPDVPPSPRLVAAAKQPVTAAPAPAGPAVVGMAVPTGDGAAVPRFGRGGAFAEALRRAKQEEEVAQVKKLPAGAGTKVEAVVPGFAPALVAGKSRNERRRLGKAKAAFRDGQASEGEWEEPKGEVVKKANAAVVVAPASKHEESEDDDDDKELDPKKKLQNLNKKLKEIEKLEQRSFDELNDSQKAKINNKDKILKQIAQLNL